jgi:tetratricopeptide (TPR) repeat protein
MSLLLEALKKAELAKQAAKAESQTAESSAAGPGVVTREKLPDITQPLEILTDDLPSSDPSVPGSRAAPAERATPAPEPTRYESEQARSAERAQAQQVFEAKEMDYNPRRPFYLTVSALVLIGAGYGGYVWWQMQPRYSYSVAQTQPRAAEAAPPAAPQPPVTAVPVPATPAPAASAPAAAPAATAAAKAPAAPAAVATIAPIQPVRPPRPRPAAARPEMPAEPARPAPRAAEPLPAIAISAPAPAVDPALERGYEALQKNDLAAAREAYQRALARDPTSRDALLGLAAVEVRSGQLDSAESRYAKLLETDPRDATALASLLSLRGQLDPVTAESRLKNLLATHPDAAPLHFALGNQYAQQSRWSEAQGAYFKAYSVDPENADYAFNLAVSLDRLHQKNLALDYYQRALALAAKRSASFNLAQTRTRVQELSR